MPWTLRKLKKNKIESISVLEFRICLNYVINLCQCLKQEQWGLRETFTTADLFSAVAFSSVGGINSSCEAFTFSTNTQFCLRLSPWWRGSMSVHVCQLWSLMKRSHKYSTAKYLHPSLEISSQTNVGFFRKCCISLFAMFEHKLKIKLVWEWWMQCCRKDTAFDLSSVKF